MKKRRRRPVGQGNEGKREMETKRRVGARKSGEAGKPIRQAKREIKKRRLTILLTSDSPDGSTDFTNACHRGCFTQCKK